MIIFLRKENGENSFFSSPSIPFNSVVAKYLTMGVDYFNNQKNIS